MFGHDTKHNTCKHQIDATGSADPLATLLHLFDYSILLPQYNCFTFLFSVCYPKSRQARYVLAARHSGLHSSFLSLDSLTSELESRLTFSPSRPTLVTLLYASSSSLVFRSHSIGRRASRNSLRDNINSDLFPSSLSDI